MSRLPVVVVALVLVGCATPFQDHTPYVPPLLRDGAPAPQPPDPTLPSPASGPRKGRCEAAGTHRHTPCG